MHNANLTFRIALPLLMFFATSLSAAETDSGTQFKVKKGGGLEMESANNDYSISLGGRHQYDYNVFDGVINKDEDATERGGFTRRSRIKISGKLNNWDYKLSYNINSGGSFDVLYASYQGWGKKLRLTLGQQKEYLGLEEAGSSASITAIERSLPSNALAAGKSVGVQLSGSDDLLTYSVGAYRETIDADDDSFDHAFTGRLVLRPINKKKTLLHLGVGYSDRQGKFDGLGSRLGVRGGRSRNANSVQVEYDRGAFANKSELWNIETAAILGPYHLMAEYFNAELSGVLDAPDLGATGYYLQAGWILTGESREYKESNASLSGVSPKHRLGAWEVFGRVDHLDVSDNPNGRLVDIDGDSAMTGTIGLNWYFGKNIKAAVNYIYAKTDDTIGGKEDGSAIAARIQYDF